MERLDVADRVHVMPVGYEHDRIVLAAERLRADRVVLLTARDASEGAGADPDGSSLDDPEGLDREAYVAAASEALDERGIEYAHRPCDVFDFYDSLGTVAAAATDHAEADVYVNLATGSKVTAIAGMIACMATGATPYYVRAERYGDGPAEGIAEIAELPTYPVDVPDRQQVAVLRYLREEGPASKKALIRMGERRELPFVADASGRKGKYRRLDSRVLDPLLEYGYVDLDEHGRTKRARLTDRGEATLRAFSYLLE